MLPKVTFVALAALSAAAVCAGAQAAPDSSVVTVRVSVADLNLASKQGASVALQRIRGAARSICGDQPSVVELERLALYDACLRSTVSKAVASLDNPIVSALYAGRTSNTPEMASR